MLIPPINFALVVDDVYRSGHPIEMNFPFLEQLGLRTIVYLGDRSAEKEEAYAQWAADHGITLHSLSMPSVREPFIMNDPAPVMDCLRILQDKTNYPVLVHSDKGKHRVGVLVGVLRKSHNWALAAIYEEYIRFARAKAEADMLFIEQCDPAQGMPPIYATQRQIDPGGDSHKRKTLV